MNEILDKAQRNLDEAAEYAKAGAADEAAVLRQVAQTQINLAYAVRDTLA